MATSHDDPGGKTLTAGASGAGPGFSYFRRMARNSVLLLLGDSAVLTVSLLLGDILLFWLRGVHVVLDRGLLLIPAWWAGAVLFRIVPGWGAGPVERLRHIEHLLLGLFAFVTATLVIARVSDARISRISFFAAYLLAAVLLPLVRTLIRALLIHAGVWGVPAVIYGTDRTAADAARTLRENPALGYRPVGVFDDEEPVNAQVSGLPVLGGLMAWTNAAPVAMVGASQLSKTRLAALVNGPLLHYQRVIILPDLADINSLWVKPRDFLGVLGLEMTSNLMDPLARFVKRWGERLLVVVTAPIWAPVLLFITLLILLEDGGAPFFIQPRIGRVGRAFRMVKFRTMVPNAEEFLRAKLEADPALREEWTSTCKLRRDPRITRIGRWLRVTSLDELPQLLNVLTGRMSLIGPRPLPPYHENQLPERIRALRAQVLPGVTGLWQVSGRSDSGNAGLERWDSYYVRNWSIWLDLIILARTVLAVVQHRGAY